MKQNVLNSSRLSEFRRKKQRILKIKIGIILFLFVALIVGLAFISRINKLNINQINISGNKIIETKDIESVVKNDISGHYLWLFPKTNFLIYPKRGIKKDLASRFKRLKDISENIQNARTLEVNVSEYQGKYLWCGVLIPVLNSNLNNDKCYFMDDSGYIFDEAPYFSGEVYFKFYGNGGMNGDIPTGTYFMKDKFTEITTLKDTLEKLGFNPSDFWLDNDNEADFSLSGQPMTGPRIIFKLDADYSKLAENLQAAISTEPLHTDLQTKLASLLYIDLRFGNKVYYKFQ